MVIQKYSNEKISAWAYRQVYGIMDRFMGLWIDLWDFNGIMRLWMGLF